MNDKRLKLAKEALDSGSYDKETIEYIFPELKDKESEDEKIRKALLEHINGIKYFLGISKDRWIAWLEKQEKQNSTDKFEPKFKNGQWIVWKDKYYKVNYDGCGYELVDQNGFITLLEYGTIDEDAHLWTIEDAKDNDIVVDKSNGTIGIFQSIGHHPDGGSYNDPSYFFLHCRYNDGFFYANFENGNMIDSDNLIPATKEQRDLLFQKMKEKGYEWNAENKELKRIKN